MTIILFFKTQEKLFHNPHGFGIRHTYLSVLKKECIKSILDYPLASVVSSSIMYVQQHRYEPKTCLMDLKGFLE